ncbi:MAG TPA: hypothetical protein GX690_03245 [Tenericutes bacterium]|nr:hypothetical protein [Mycoplasmatota bacterium]
MKRVLRNIFYGLAFVLILLSFSFTPLRTLTALDNTVQNSGPGGTTPPPIGFEFENE